MRTTMYKNSKTDLENQIRSLTEKLNTVTTCSGNELSNLCYLIYIIYNKRVY